MEEGVGEGFGEMKADYSVRGGIGVIMCFGYRRRKRRRMGTLRWLGRVLD